jgi:hypothetical protein
MSSLTTDRQATSVTQASIAADIHETFDVELNLLPQVSLDISL